VRSWDGGKLGKEFGSRNAELGRNGERCAGEVACGLEERCAFGAACGLFNSITIEPIHPSTNQLNQLKTRYNL